MKHLGTLFGAPLLLDTDDETVFDRARKLLATLAAAYFHIDKTP